MRRWLFNIAAAASLLLCLATVAVWIRSYFVADEFRGTAVHWPAENTYQITGVSFSTDGARIALFALRGESTFSGDARWLPAIVKPHHVINPEGYASRWSHPRETSIRPAPILQAVSQVNSHGVFVYLRHGPFSAKINAGVTISGTGNEADVVLPIWTFSTLTALLPLAWIALFLRRRHRRHDNACTACGYDLTGNTSGICPECGTAIGLKAP